MLLQWFKRTFSTFFTALFLTLSLCTFFWIEALAQDSMQGTSDIFVTVNYTEQINVRNGPSTVLYDIIGHMQPGETAQALGVSPGRDWVEIVFPSGPGGVGWVHISLISISAGTLQIVEPPPTVTPLVTPTIDPTLAAAYVFEPTVTRMPTFTPPPPLEVPHFTPMPVKQVENGMPMGALMIGSGIVGILSFVISLFRRR